MVKIEPKLDLIKIFAEFELLTYREDCCYKNPYKFIVHPIQ